MRITAMELTARTRPVSGVRCRRSRGNLGLPQPGHREVGLCGTGGLLSAQLNERIRIVEEEWGKGNTLGSISPSLANVPAAVELMGRFERASLRPRAARRHLEWISEIDTRSVARSLHVPTLVMHRSEDQLIPISGGRWLGNNIPGARFVELPGDDHAPWSGDIQLFAEELEEFLTGARGEVELDRALATVLFTDIVGSTERAAEKLGGIAVHIGARVMAQAQPGEVLVSSTVRDLVSGSGLTFAKRGTHTLGGIPGAWNLYAVTSRLAVASHPGLSSLYGEASESLHPTPIEVHTRARWGARAGRHRPSRASPALLVHAPD